MAHAKYNKFKSLDNIFAQYCACSPTKISVVTLNYLRKKVLQTIFNTEKRLSTHPEYKSRIYMKSNYRREWYSMTSTFLQSIQLRYVKERGGKVRLLQSHVYGANFWFQLRIYICLACFSVHGQTSLILIERALNQFNYREILEKHSPLFTAAYYVGVKNKNHFNKMVVDRTDPST